MSPAWRALLRLSRPEFLAGGVVLHGLGAALALADGLPLYLPALILGQLTVSAGQLTTHYSNEYFDQAADRANLSPGRWSGGSRVLADGALPPRIALVAALVALAAALGWTTITAVVIRPGGLVVGLFLLCLTVAWGYSAPPLRLHSRGLGEPCGAILIAGLTPLAGFALQAGAARPLPPGSPSALLWPCLVVAPLVCFQFGMLVVVSLPDVEGDAAVGKRTLAVRLGRRRASRLAALAILAGYAAPVGHLASGAPAEGWIAAAYLAWLPLALWQSGRLWRGQGERSACWDSLSFWAIGLIMGPALTLIAFSLFA